MEQMKVAQEILYFRFHGGGNPCVDRHIPERHKGVPMQQMGVGWVHLLGGAGGAINKL